MIKPQIETKIFRSLMILLFILVYGSIPYGTIAEKSHREEERTEISVWMNIQVHRGDLFSIANVYAFIDDRQLAKFENGTSEWIRTSATKGLHIIRLRMDQNHYTEIPLDLQEAIYIEIEVTTKWNELEINYFDATPRYNTGYSQYDEALRQYDQALNPFLRAYDIAYSGDGYFSEDGHKRTERYVSSYIFLNKSTSKYARIQDGTINYGTYYETEMSKEKNGEKGVRFYIVRLENGLCNDFSRKL